MFNNHLILLTAREVKEKDMSWKLVHMNLN